MDTQSIINIVLIIFSSVSGWFAREMWTAVKELKFDLAKLREELPREYVMRDDYKSDIKEIKEMLLRLMEKLEHKQDK